MSIDATALPPELLVTPQPLIGFCGLDVGQNTVHKAIWEAFSSNRKADRPALQFKLLSGNYEYPVAKPKRASYEWYHPKGILKRNWMLKHLHVLPSVVVLFQDMEWKDPQWTEKQMQCVAIIQSLRNALQERNTRLCLVLLQNSAPLPTGDDLYAAEHAASLTSACGLNGKMFFILPYAGNTMRLESAFLDMSQSYYALMSKRIRTHRDQLTASHTVLKIRHQFKLGFVAEIRQDFSTALKHYTQSYASLDEIRINDANCLEIKTISGFLNYKICRLMFKLKVPRDAINHFLSHIEKYKNRAGFKDIVFEHYAWMSTQHSMFAEVFCEAIKNGLPALQTQHPGIYFYKAAEYTGKRRKACQEACKTFKLPLETSMTESSLQNTATSLYSEFFGIRSVKTGDPAAEQQVNIQLCELERSFTHSSTIITQLSQAMAQYKIYKCLRFRKKLAIDMAEEYQKSGDNAKALTLYSLMLPEYRQEKWSMIFTEVLLKTLRCAFLTASITDFVACSIEALSLKHHGDQKERMLVLDNLWQVFKGLPPIPHGQSAPEIHELWSNALKAVKSPIQIDLDKVLEVFDMTASFKKVELSNNETIEVFLIARVLTDVLMRLCNFNVIITNGTNNYKLEAAKYTVFPSLLELRKYHQSTVGAQQHLPIESNFFMEPGHYYQLLCSIDAQQFHENTQLSITRMEAQMGSEKIVAFLTRSAKFARKPFRHHTRFRDLDDNIHLNPICYISPTFHLNTQTNIDSDTTILANEYFSVVTTITNPHNVYLENVVLNVSVAPSLRNNVFLLTDISPGKQKLHSEIRIDFAEITVQSSTTANYYVYSLVETMIPLQQKLTYTMQVESHNNTVNAIVPTMNATTPTSDDNSPDNVNARSLNMAQVITPNHLAAQASVQIELVDENRLRKTRIDTLIIKCGLEFKFTGRFYTLNKKPLTHIYRGENFLLRANAEVTSPHDVELLDVLFICDHNLVQSKYSFKRKKFTNIYRTGDKLEDVIVLRTDASQDNWINAKDWDQRKNDKNEVEPNVTTTNFVSRLHQHKVQEINTNVSHKTDPSGNVVMGNNLSTPYNMNKSLMAKIPTSMTIVNNNNNNNNAALNNILNVPNMSASLISDDSKSATSDTTSAIIEQQLEAPTKNTDNTRLIFHRAIDAIQSTGGHRGFIKGVYTGDEQQDFNLADTKIFGVYCIRWRRHGSKGENESRFVISGLEIVEPPINIYCTIEEKMFVKMPMSFKVVLKNPTAKVLHLIATLTISNTDNFICSGHKQLDVSIMAYNEKELIYNLYPLSVGWQNMPELSLEYNTVADPNKNDVQNELLSELVQRALPKRVFILPPLKQQTK